MKEVVKEVGTFGDRLERWDRPGEMVYEFHWIKI